MRAGASRRLASPRTASGAVILQRRPLDASIIRRRAINPIGEGPLEGDKSAVINMHATDRTQRTNKNTPATAAQQAGLKNQRCKEPKKVRTKDVADVERNTPLPPSSWPPFPIHQREFRNGTTMSSSGCRGIGSLLLLLLLLSFALCKHSDRPTPAASLAVSFFHLNVTTPRYECLLTPP